MPAFTHLSAARACRSASIALLILGGLAALCGLMLVAVVPMVNDPAAAQQFKDLFDQLRRQTSYDLRTEIVVSAAFIFIYAAAAVTLGVLIRGGGRATAIVTLVVTALVAAVMAVQAGAAVLLGDAANAVVGVTLAAVHGMIVKWMIQALGRPAAVATLPRPPLRKPPLADYYIPPAPPA